MCRAPPAAAAAAAAAVFPLPARRRRPHRPPRTAAAVRPHARLLRRPPRTTAAVFPPPAPRLLRRPPPPTCFVCAARWGRGRRARTATWGARVWRVRVWCAWAAWCTSREAQARAGLDTGLAGAVAGRGAGLAGTGRGRLYLQSPNLSMPKPADVSRRIKCLNWALIMMDDEYGTAGYGLAPYRSRTVLGLPNGSTRCWVRFPRRPMLYEGHDPFCFEKLVFVIATLARPSAAPSVVVSEGGATASQPETGFFSVAKLLLLDLLSLHWWWDSTPGAARLNQWSAAQLYNAVSQEAEVLLFKCAKEYIHVICNVRTSMEGQTDNLQWAGDAAVGTSAAQAGTRQVTAWPMADAWLDGGVTRARGQRAKRAAGEWAGSRERDGMRAKNGQRTQGRAADRGTRSGQKDRQRVTACNGQRDRQREKGPLADKKAVSGQKGGRTKRRAVDEKAGSGQRAAGKKEQAAGHEYVQKKPQARERDRRAGNGQMAKDGQKGKETARGQRGGRGWQRPTGDWTRARAPGKREGRQRDTCL
ncbi:hypothetical protein GGX14DRAFT_404770 [Mycena pura]|uniref:Uncharacterized protein n=1 Tax=Mycena pura TaxID=153505 RepID=A0AAD6UWY3_9AGAR|nr:hypothetical protein GGX14DRAFT_404770 [Mycena pura]